MADISWPAGLPPMVGILGTGSTDALVPEGQRSTFDGGNERVRNQRISAPTRISITLPPLTHAQLGTLLAFLDGPSNNGTARFNAPVRLPSGLLGTRVVRFASAVPAEDLGTLRQVSFDLDIWNWRG